MILMREYVEERYPGNRRMSRAACQFGRLGRDGRVAPLPAGPTGQSI